MKRLRTEDGFTIVEVLIAAVLLVLAAAALMTTLAGARNATYRGEQSQVAADIAQREIEALRAIPFSKLAMTSAPVHSADPNDPRNRVSGGNFDLGDGKPAAPMVVNGGPVDGGGTVTGGTVNPGPVSFSSGDVSGTIQRFVVWQNDPRCPETLCDGQQDYKRIVVAVALDTTASGGARRYVEFQSNTVNPAESVGTNPNLPTLGTPTVAQQFWISDRRCEPTTEPARTDLNKASNHDTRDTRGSDCAATTANRPGALLTEAPDDLIDIVDNLDYATDLEPTPPDADSGLQLNLPASNGCTLLPPSGRAPNEAHFWVSRPINADADYVLKGGLTLKLWTRSINDVQISGKLCVVVFLRAQNGTNTVLAQATSSHVTWPHGEWDELTVPMTFTPRTVTKAATAANYQTIGVGIGLDKQGGASNQFQFQYDTVRFDSRLEVETTTPLE